MLEANIQSLPALSTTGTGAVLDLYGQGSVHLTAYVITTNATVSAGAVTVEEAHDAAYTGTWAVLLSPITPVANTMVSLHTEGAFGAVRARVTTTITGGATAQVILRATSHGD